MYIIIPCLTFTLYRDIPLNTWTVSQTMKKLHDETQWSYGWSTVQLDFGLWKTIFLVLQSLIDTLTVSSLACQWLPSQYHCFTATQMLKCYLWQWRVRGISLEGAEGENWPLRRCSRFQIPIKWRQRRPKIFITIVLPRAGNETNSWKTVYPRLEKSSSDKNTPLPNFVHCW